MTGLPLGDLVYRTTRGRVWHWPSPHHTGGTVAGCTGADLDLPHPLPVVSAPMGDRCTGNGCGGRWQEWLRRTIHAALVDELARCRPTSQQETPA